MDSMQIVKVKSKCIFAELTMLRVSDESNTCAYVTYKSMTALFDSNTLKRHNG
jgi:hypothetical protein